MTPDQLEDQVRSTRRETDHRFPSVMTIELDDPVRRQRQLRHDLAIGMSGGAFSRRQRIDDADTCPGFGQMEGRRASGNASAHDDAVEATIRLEFRELRSTGTAVSGHSGLNRGGRCRWGLSGMTG